MKPGEIKPRSMPRLIADLRDDAEHFAGPVGEFLGKLAEEIEEVWYAAKIDRMSHKRNGSTMYNKTGKRK